MRALPLACLIAAAFAVSGPPARAEGERRTAVVTGAGVSMDQAVKMAEQRFKARVVRAESQQNGDQTIYVLRLLNESGRVWTVRVDASNGAVL